MKISEILLKYDTDKNRGVVDGKNGHYYGEAYDEIFSLFDKNAKLNILEIGVQKGGSLCAWKEFFPNSKIYGIDIEDSIIDDYRKDNFEYFIEDVKSPELLKKLQSKTFDIIIDDGSHQWHDVEYVLLNFTNLLKKNGVLIIEDCQAPDNWLKSVNNFNFNLTILTYDFRNKNNHYDDYIITLKNDNN
jgi:SAM-dependent methyltransferase